MKPEAPILYGQSIEFSYLVFLATANVVVGIERRWCSVNCREHGTLWWCYYVPFSTICYYC